MQGIIVKNISNIYVVKVKEEKETKRYEASARGKFKKDEIIPVVGDFVEIEVLDEESKQAVINEIMDRKVYIKRPRIANITQLVFVLSIKNPKPDLLMLDKQLAFAEFLGIDSFIVVNKLDLDKKAYAKHIKALYEKIGYDVIETEARNEKGIEALKQKLSKQVNAFSGNSGVGKSTLINNIFKSEMTLEGEISERNKRGKNTTTSIELYEINKDTYIADTPGFSVFSIEEIESKDLAHYFKEFKSHIQYCEFQSNCTHIKEINCGIKQALEKGKIEQERYDRFCKIYEALKQKEERKKW